MKKHTKKNISETDYKNVLNKLEDVFESTTAKFMVVGSLLTAVETGTYLSDLDKFEFIVSKRSLNKYALTVLKENLGESWQDFEENGVPIKVKVINKNYKFMKYPDVRYYQGCTLYIPNPLSDYLKIKQLIK